MQTRRDLLRRSAALASMLGGLGLLPVAAQAAWARAAFEARTLADLTAALGASAPTPSPDVTLQCPDIAESGAAVAVACASSLPEVARLLILVEKNPTLLAAMFELSDAVDPSFNTRVKMAQSSTVFAVAITADGRTLFTQKDVQVTLGGCGD